MIQENRGGENLPRPFTQTDIRSFLGLAGNYGKFVDFFASIESIMTTLTKKRMKFDWSEAR